MCTFIYLLIAYGAPILTASLYFCYTSNPTIVYRSTTTNSYLRYLIIWWSVLLTFYLTFSIQETLSSADLLHLLSRVSIICILFIIRWQIRQSAHTSSRTTLWGLAATRGCAKTCLYTSHTLYELSWVHYRVHIKISFNGAFE